MQSYKTFMKLPKNSDYFFLSTEKMAPNITLEAISTQTQIQLIK